MIKKYFAMTIIAASVSLAACSSDDDDDDNNAAMDPTREQCVDDPTIALCATLYPDTQPSELTATVTDPAVTAYDVIGGAAAAGTHSALLAALNAVPALANAADDMGNPITVLAPDDTAFADLVEATVGVATAEELITALTTDDTSTAVDESLALARILGYHVIPGVADLVIDTPVNTALVDDGVTVQLTPIEGSESPSGFSVTDSAGTTVDLAEVASANTGIVYTVNAVLTPPDAPVVDNGGGGPVTGGDVLTTMENDSDGFTKALAALGANTTKLDEDDSSQDPWTIFAPTDAALGDAEITLQDMVYVGVLQTPAVLLADSDRMITTFDPANSKTYAIGGTDEASLTIGGAPAIFLGGGTSGTYKLTAVPEAQ